MRNPVCNMEINYESLEMYAFITKVLGDTSDSKDENLFSWTLIDGVYISLQMVSGEAYPTIIIEDAFDLFDKVYQIIGYAHYREYKVICNF